MAQLWREVVRKRSRESDNYLQYLHEDRNKQEKQSTFVYSKDSEVVTKYYFNHFSVLPSHWNGRDNRFSFN